MDRPRARSRSGVTPVTSAFWRASRKTLIKRRSGAIAQLVVLVVAAFSSTANALEGGEAKKLFNQRCTACHTFGKGVKVGPDLKGVTERRPRRWLLSFIRGSQRMIQGGDAVAVDLFRQ